MKKAVVYLLAGVMMLGIGACGMDGNGGQDSSSGQNSSTIQSGSGDQNNSDGQNSSSDLADGGAADGSDDSQSGTADGWSEEMAELRAAAVEALGDNYWPDMMLDADIMEMRFGITQDMYEDYMAEMPMMSTHVDTLVIVKAKEDQVEAVQSALNTYRDVQINDSLQYPMNMGKIQASCVETIGNYVLFVQLGGETDMDAAEEAVIAGCQALNQKVVEAVRQKVEQ